MIRSILNQSMLATACVLAIGAAGQVANASNLSALQKQDVNDSRTPAGKAYAAVKPCPFATSSQVSRDANSNPAAVQVGSTEMTRSSSDRTTR